ncbi:MAG: hypothetical protein WC178_00885 [Candidatus Paceibacterota bacterium]
MLTREQIEEFRRIWKKEFGEEISYEYAEKRGGEIVELMRMVYGGKMKRERKKKDPNPTLDISDDV